MQVCTSLQTDNHASTPPLSFLQAGCPSCRPTNGIKALKANYVYVFCCKNVFDEQTNWEEKREFTRLQSSCIASYYCKLYLMRKMNK